MLSDKTITESETLSNRLWGSLEFVLGVAEMAGATALCVAPEPTGLTKAGCVVVGAHSMDTLRTAAQKVMTGSNARTATSRIAAQTARLLGADENTAVNIGVAVDVAIPLSVAGMVGAARVSYVRAGSLKIAEHEAIAGIRVGGHTIAKHVAIPEKDLLARLARSPMLPSASSFYTLQQAEKVISSSLKSNRIKIIHWANANNSERILELTHHAGTSVGYGFKRGQVTKESINKVRIVLIKESYNRKPYYILTAYPVMD